MTSCTAQIFVKSKEKQHHAAQILQIFDKAGMWVMEGMGSLWKMCRDVKANGQHEGPFSHSTVGNKEQKSHLVASGTGFRSQLGSQDMLRGENAWARCGYPTSTSLPSKDNLRGFFPVEGKPCPCSPWGPSPWCTVGYGTARSRRACWYGRFNKSKYTDVKWQVEMKHFGPCWSGHMSHMHLLWAAVGL